MAPMRCERGQATIEWVGLVLLASLVLTALATAVEVKEGRSFGALVSERIFCAVGGGGCGGAAQAGIEARPPRGVASFRGSSVGRSGGGGFAAHVSVVGPCSIYSCNPVASHCTAVYGGGRGRRFCLKRAAADGKPSRLISFLAEKFKACLIGATGAKAFTPFAEELLRRRATKSPKEAYRALKRGLRRSKDAVVRGNPKPGLVGCLGGTIGL